MGQQQLLLVILVTIIVGIATVVAINTFSSAADSANVDAVRQDVLSAASSAQQYYMKPTSLGGGGNSFSGMTVDDFTTAGTKDSDTKWHNQNGTYVISTSSGSFTITAYPSSGYDGSGPNTTGPSLTAEITPDDITWTDNDASS